MADRDKIGFLHVPGSSLSFPRASSTARAFFQKIPGALPPPCQAVVVSGLGETQSNGRSEALEVLQVTDRKDRWLYRMLAQVHALVPGRQWTYPFRSYFHRSYTRRAASLFRSREVDSIVFPLYPQWVTALREANPKARLILWLQRDWLSTGPSHFENHLKEIDHIVCSSKYLADRVAAQYPWTEERLRVVQGGVDAGFWKPGSNRSRHLLLYAGRLTPEKGIHVLLQAFERVRMHYPDAQLILAGSIKITPSEDLIESPRRDVRIWRRQGERYEVMLRREAQRLKSVFLTDQLDAKGLLRMYRNASLYIYPCLWNDPAGTQIMEPMACGLPVVASGCGGIPEVAQDGRSGLLTEPGDVDGLVEAIERLFENKDLSQRMSAAARTRVEEQFDWKKVAESLAEVVSEA
ncbi:MAG: glycosyltransferase family 4 protein [Planctomycetota bacterium]